MAGHRSRRAPLPIGVLEPRTPHPRDILARARSLRTLRTANSKLDDEARALKKTRRAAPLRAPNLYAIRNFALTRSVLFKRLPRTSGRDFDGRVFERFLELGGHPSVARQTP